MTRAERYRRAREYASYIAQSRGLYGDDLEDVCNAATRAITAGESVEQAKSEAESLAARLNHLPAPILVQLTLAVAAVAVIAIRVIEIIGGAA